jgi:hypothetical protein
VPPRPGRCSTSSVDGVGAEPDDAGVKADDVITFEYPIEPYSEVVPGLFQASAEQSPAEMLSMFDVLIDVGGWDRWVGEPDPRYRFHPLDDGPSIPDEEMIHTVGESIAAHVRDGKHVAVNCLAGVNRSGLLVGRALVELGSTPEEAIEAVRLARGPMALSNPRFVRFLLEECTSRALARRRQLSFPL